MTGVLSLNKDPLRLERALARIGDNKNATMEELITSYLIDSPCAITWKIKPYSSSVSNTVLQKIGYKYDKQELTEQLDLYNNSQSYNYEPYVDLPDLLTYEFKISYDDISLTEESYITYGKLKVKRKHKVKGRDKKEHIEWIKDPLGIVKSNPSIYIGNDYIRYDPINRDINDIDEDLKLIKVSYLVNLLMVHSTEHGLVRMIDEQ